MEVRRFQLRFGYLTIPFYPGALSWKWTCAQAAEEADQDSSSPVASRVILALAGVIVFGAMGFIAIRWKLKKGPKVVVVSSASQERPTVAVSNANEEGATLVSNGNEEGPTTPLGTVERPTQPDSE